ncbi:MAG: purine-cytosine permease family protein [Gammaproteobacteria bacterium]
MDTTSEFAEVAIKKEQQVAWLRVAAVSSMVAFSLPTFITGLEIYQGLSAINAIWALLVGSAILFAIGSMTASIGANTHMSSYLLVRIAFGDKGAGVVNIAFAISLLGWFGININLFADASGRLLIDLFGLAVPSFILSILASLVMTLTTLVGFRAINILATAMMPVLVLVTAFLVIYSLHQHSFSALMDAPKPVSMSLGDGVSVIVGNIIVGVIILPDITRFVRHWSGAVSTAFITLMLVQLTVMSAAAIASAATGQTEILNVMLALGLGLGAFIIVITSSWVLNALNLYSTVLSVKATFPKLNEKTLTLALGAVGIVAALMNILDHFVTFLFYLSVIFVPVAGVIIIDYFFVRRAAYRIESLAKNRAYAPKALFASGIGAVTAIIMSENIVPSLTGMAAVDAMLLAAFIYSALSFGAPLGRALKRRRQSENRN